MPATANRKSQSQGSRSMAFGCLGLLCVLVLLAQHPSTATVSSSPSFNGPISSQPIALTADGAFLASVNPDANTVSLFDVRSDRNRKLLELPTQTEPWGVAWTPDGRKLYVANTISGTVTYYPTNLRNGAVGKAIHIPVGTEPYGLAVTPNGSKLYVTNARSNTVSVISTASNTVIKTLSVGPEPRGLAITNDGDVDDNDERVYVTHFFSVLRSAKVDGLDDAKEGRVTVLSTLTDAVTSVVTLNPLSDSGFKASGDALNRIPPGAGFDFVTGAYPNQLNNIGIKGNFAYVPNTGASPNGPVRFNVNTQSLLSVFDTRNDLEIAAPLNMHTAVRDQASSTRRFITVPWSIGFKHASEEGYVISAASNIAVKINVNASTGLAAVQLNPLNSSTVLQIPTGKNPRGITINSTDTRAYVMNYISRDVTVINLTGVAETVMGTMSSSRLPVPGSDQDKIHIGKELYNTSIGDFDPAPGTTTPITGRMSAAGWGSCSSCHAFGLADNVTWIFATGPRQTIPQHADFDQTNAARSVMRVLNWSANRDEQEDFELNIRNVSGGQGMLVLADGITPDPNVTDLIPLANGGRTQLKVRGIGAWDALKAYIQFGVRAPISSVSKTEPDVIAGRALFISANCQQCHGGPQWTSGRVRFAPPPSTALISGGQLLGELRKVGTFDPAAFNEVTAAAGTPMGNDGFVPASLLSAFVRQGSLLHGASARTFDDVLQNVTHRSAGTSGVDTLSSPSDRARIARFLQSIDAATAPINF